MNANYQKVQVMPLFQNWRGVFVAVLIALSFHFHLNEEGVSGHYKGQ